MGASPLRVTFDIAKWRALPLAMQRALLREAVARLKPDLRDADFTPIDNAARWSQTATSGHTAYLVGGLGVQVVGEELRVAELENLVDGLSDKRETSNVILNMPGITEFLGQKFTTVLLDSFALAEIENNLDLKVAYLDAALGPFRVRTRREGERFRPLGMDGTIKLSDYMINRRLPVDRRDEWPLVCCGENGETVLWVCGYAIAEQGRVREGTRQVVRVEMRANQ
jgi:tRNA(Ile)-lysidine synthase